MLNLIHAVGLNARLRQALRFFLLHIPMQRSLSFGQRRFFLGLLADGFCIHHRSIRPFFGASDERCGKILGLQHCYAFEMAPDCSDGIEVDLDQIVCDARRLLDRSIQKLEELARRGTVASLRKLDISNAEFEVMKCLRDIEANGGKVELSAVSKPSQELAAIDAAHRPVPSQLVDGSMPAREVTAVRMPLKGPRDEAFLAVAREDRPAARVAGRVMGIEDLPDARVAIIVNGGRPTPAPDLNRDTAIELYRANAEVQGLLTPMGAEMVLTKLTWQARLPLESAPM